MALNDMYDRELCELQDMVLSDGCREGRQTKNEVHLLPGARGRSKPGQQKKKEKDKRYSNRKKRTKIAILDSTVKYTIEREKDDGGIDKKSRGYGTGKMQEEFEAQYIKQHREKG